MPNEDSVCSAQMNRADCEWTWGWSINPLPEGRSMKRREFTALLGAAVFWPIPADAQQRVLPIIGLLSSRSAEEATPKGADIVIICLCLENIPPPHTDSLEAVFVATAPCAAEIFKTVAAVDEVLANGEFNLKT
jgi:hypothetical protein